mmetsp:Transcript_13708/g.43112  ORF Transcript_13708/g.43112 Transcript_13708/m.43112 type:complete len:292 (+) Transcript_13708:2181-3056(+)
MLHVTSLVGLAQGTRNAGKARHDRRCRERALLGRVRRGVRQKVVRVQQGRSSLKGSRTRRKIIVRQAWHKDGERGAERGPRRRLALNRVRGACFGGSFGCRNLRSTKGFGKATEASQRHRHCSLAMVHLGRSHPLGQQLEQTDGSVSRARHQRHHGHEEVRQVFLQQVVDLFGVVLVGPVAGVLGLLLLRRLLGKAGARLRVHKANDGFKHFAFHRLGQLGWQHRQRLEGGEADGCHAVGRVSRRDESTQILHQRVARLEARRLGRQPLRHHRLANQVNGLGSRQLEADRL